MHLHMYQCKLAFKEKKKKEKEKSVTLFPTNGLLENIFTGSCSSELMRRPKILG